MRLELLTSCAAVAAAVGLNAAVAWAQIEIPTVSIGNPGNAADPATGVGAVSYIYLIGSTEVTNAQYAAFLNAKARSDPLALYAPNMASVWGGITRGGTDGAYFYAGVRGREDHPVNYVSFWDAVRFANWLHNGQGGGDTETGAYTLTAGGMNANTVTRNAGWRWAVTSEDEWYKAAYHQPASASGDADDYWQYPTSSNTVSTAQANFSGVVGETTPGGFYAANFYGAFDMGGNVHEWNEWIPPAAGAARGLRGGDFLDGQGLLSSASRDAFPASGEDRGKGFRVSVMCVAPAIESSPGSVSACEAEAVTLAVLTAGTTPQFQWRRNEVVIEGANAATFTIPSVALADAGSYDCVVTNACGSVTSDLAVVTVRSPQILTPPVSQTVNVDQPVFFALEADPASPCFAGLTYQWQRRNPLVEDDAAPNAWLDLSDGGGFAGTHSPILAIFRPTPGVATGYRCRIANACGCEADANGVIHTEMVNFVAACPSDFNNDGAVDGDDVIGFFERWDAGC